MKLFFMDSIARSTNIILTEKNSIQQSFLSDTRNQLKQGDVVKEGFVEITGDHRSTVRYHVLVSSFKNILSY